MTELKSTVINVEQTAAFLDVLATFAEVEHASRKQTVSRANMTDAAAKAGTDWPRWITDPRGDTQSPFYAERGVFFLPTIEECVNLGRGYSIEPGKRRRSRITTETETETVVQNMDNASTAVVTTDEGNEQLRVDVSKLLGTDIILGASDSVPYIPSRNPGYVRWGHFDTVRQIVSSRHFLPAMIVGPSGNGKTDMCSQVAADLGREFVRVNITIQTDEDDLLGGFRLVNGDTKFSLGPVPMAMLRGAILLLDEVDLGGATMMCLQPVLEGQPLYLKKIGRYIHPAAGFNVITTANTKGRGDDGRYMHTGIMNDAMLERFSVMFEQGWPDSATERKILGHILKSGGMYDSNLVRHLVDFANTTRANFETQSCTEQLSTRRLIHMVKTYMALASGVAADNPEERIAKAMDLTLARFDVDIAQAFKGLWGAIHDSATPSPSGDRIDPVIAPF